MRPDEAAAELARRAREMHDAPITDAALTRNVREIAAGVRAQAARAGHAIGVRVVSKNHSVRVTVTGYRAALYRKSIQDELERRMPDIKAEIRTQMRTKP